MNIFIYALFMCYSMFSFSSLSMVPHDTEAKDCEGIQLEKTAFQIAWSEATNYQKFHKIDHYSFDAISEFTAGINELRTKFLEVNAFRKAIIFHVGNFPGFIEQNKDQFKTLVYALAKEFSVGIKRELLQRQSSFESFIDERTHFRKVPVRVGEGNSTFLPKGKSIEEVEHEFDGFVDELYAKLSAPEENDPISIAAWALHAFNAIHPLLDGNGRASRIIMNMVLVHFGMQAVVLAETSEEQDTYTKALEQADQGSYECLNNLIAFALKKVVLEKDFVPSFREYSDEELFEIIEDRVECIQQ